MRVFRPDHIKIAEDRVRVVAQVVDPNADGNGAETVDRDGIAQVPVVAD